MVSHMPDEAFLLLCHRFCVPRIANHPCSLTTVAFHPRGRGNCSAVKKNSLCSVAYEHCFGCGFWDRAEVAGRSEPKDLAVVSNLSADYTCLLLPPMVVADSSSLKENITLCLSTSSNEASPVLTLFVVQLVLDDGFI